MRKLDTRSCERQQKKQYVQERVNYRYGREIGDNVSASFSWAHVHVRTESHNFRSHGQNENPKQREKPARLFVACIKLYQRPLTVLKYRAELRSAAKPLTQDAFSSERCEPAGF